MCESDHYLLKIIALITYKNKNLGKKESTSTNMTRNLFQKFSEYRYKQNIIYDSILMKRSWNISLAENKNNRQDKYQKYVKDERLLIKQTHCYGIKMYDKHLFTSLVESIYI